MKIVLDGHGFELKSDTGVMRTPLVEWPTNTRFDGQQKRKDRTLLSSYVIDDWSGGLGIERENVENANHATRLWDAENVDTRFPSQIILSPAFTFCTIVPSRGDLNLVLQHLDQLYFVETTRSVTVPVASSTGLWGYAYKFTAPNIVGSYNSLGVIKDIVGNGTSSFGSISAVYSSGQKIGAIIAHQNVYDVGSASVHYNILTEFAAIGSLYTVASAGRFDSGIHYNRLGRMSDLSGTIHFLEHSTTNQVRFGIADQSFITPDVKVAKDSTIGSYLAPLVNDGINMYTYLPEGIYDFDITPNIVVSTQGARDKNAQQVMFKNELYFKNSYSLIHYDGVNLKGVGYDLEDGLPSDKMGEITAMTSNYKWIYAAVKGATYSHILTRDQGGAWQYFARIPSAGLWVREMFLNNSPDAIDRLWCLFDNYAYPGYFLNPVKNPLVAGTYAYIEFPAFGYFDKPIIDGGLGEIKAGFYDISTSWKGFLNANIPGFVYYGLDTAIPTQVYLGYIPTINHTFIFGSPYGIEGYRIQTRLALRTNTAGTTPIFNNAVIHYLKDPNKRESFEFTIDARETARHIGLPQEAILATLSQIMDTKTLMPFYYGLVATRQVKVLDIPSQEDIENDELGGERNAFVRLRVSEIL